jgi:serine/threonine-protein kinase
MTLESVVNELLLRWEERPALTPEDLCREYAGRADHAALLEAVRRGIRELQAVARFLTPPPKEGDPVQSTRLAGAGTAGAPPAPGRPGAVPPPAEADTAAGPRYRQLARHAQGGLGEVWRALDEELHREVALKRIRGEYRSDAESRRSFLREAEITAKLEHPGVVPVHGLVHDADGQPYYAMRFIQGTTLQAAVEQFHAADRQPHREPGERSLALRELLGRFIAVCNTVAYAHSRGVLHRDLKPANIMLGPYGETLVVDWGLAKPFARDEAERAGGEDTLVPRTDGAAETQPGQVKGTPAYMSPEQAAGRWDAVGPASDIYGLGAILYALLTGRPPVKGPDVFAMLEQVKRGEVVPPRQVKPGVPKALEAVCRKAMAREPAERYARALDLAADVEHWLADEPVSAYREPWPARLARRARRHRTLVFSAGAALVVLAVSLGVLAAVLTKHNHDLEAANARERQARDDERLAKDQARGNFRLARQAVKDSCVQISLDPRLKQADLNALRKQLLETAARFHEKFKEQEGDDPDVRAERAGAYFELGFIAQLIGSQEEAIGHYQQALAIWTALVTSYPDKREYRGALADCYNSAAAMYAATGRPKETEDAYLKSLALYQELVDADPGENGPQAHLAQVQGNLALWYVGRQRFKEAEDLYGKALIIHQRLVNASPGKPEPLAALANRRHKLGYLYSVTNQHAQAGEAYRQALTVRQELSREHPDDLQYLEELGSSHFDLGAWYRADGKPQQAEEAYKQAVEAFRRLADTRPSVADYQKTLAVTLGNLGLLYQANRQTQQALDAYRQALEIQERLAKLYPTTVRYAVYLGGSYHNMGLRLTQNDDPKAALPWFDKAQATLEDVRRRDPGDVEARQFLRNTHWNRAYALLWLDRPADALKDWDRALELEGDGADRAFLRMSRALTQTRLGQYEQAVSLAEELVGPPATANHTVYSAACLFSRASVEVGRDAKRAAGERQALAEQYAARAVALLRRNQAQGYFKEPALVADLKRNTDLAPLRSREDFRKLLLELPQQTKP